jgi:hypothetical protein
MGLLPDSLTSQWRIWKNPLISLFQRERLEMTTLRLFGKVADGQIAAGRDYDDLDIAA